ncbi:MAG: hypothetical protein ACP5US_12225 [Candidatus Kryptoniota bacterium]
MVRRTISTILILSISNSIFLLFVYRISLSNLSMEKGYETTGVLNVLDDSVSSHPHKSKDIPSIIGVLNERETRFKLRYQVVSVLPDGIGLASSFACDYRISLFDKAGFLVSYRSSLPFLSTLLI